MTGSHGATVAAQEFRQYLSDDWAAWMADYPEFATRFGFPGQNHRWTDDSPAGIERRIAHLRSSLGRCRSFDRASIPPDERLNYDLYRELLESSEAGLRFGDDPLPIRWVVPRNLRMPISQLDGIHIDASETLDLQPREHLTDLEDLVARLEALPAAIDQQIALMRDGAVRGYTPPRVALQGVPHQIDGLLPSDPMSSPLLQPFAHLPPRVPEGDRARLTGRARASFTATVAPALERLRDYLVREYLPGCREPIAATALPDGPTSYAYRVRWQTTTDLTPQQIHDIGLAEVARIRAQMQAVAASTGFRGTLAEFNQFLKSDPRFVFARPEELIDGYRAIGKKTDPALARLFGKLPRLPYGVLPVPEFRAPVSVAAYYMSGAPSVGRPGYFFANTYDLSARYRWEMEGLSLHEAVPGHHLQISLGQEVEGLPDFRRFAGYGAFVEGWGLYAESLGEELGLYEDPYSKFGQLTYDMWRSIRLVVDTGMHALGWSRDRAIRFFRDNTGKSDLDITVEVDRYLVWPAQALGYKIGQLKFRELRTLAEQRLGERFDVRAFHDLVLSQSALPLGVLESRVRAWIEETASRRT